MKQNIVITGNPHALVLEVKKIDAEGESNAEIGGREAKLELGMLDYFI
ncbi:hypothetical protein [Terribacillus saccharophilus]|nr:hypothetical protein [Terribacillus saccharophilus]